MGFGTGSFGRGPFGGSAWTKRVLYDFLPELQKNTDASQAGGVLSTFVDGLTYSFEALRTAIQNYDDLNDPLLVRSQYDENKRLRLGTVILPQGELFQYGTTGFVDNFLIFNAPTARLTNSDVGKLLTVTRSKVSSNNITVIIAKVLSPTQVLTSPSFSPNDKGPLSWSVTSQVVLPKGQQTVQVLSGDIQGITPGWTLVDGYASFPITARSLLAGQVEQFGIDGSIDSDGTLNAPSAKFSLSDTFKPISITGSTILNNNVRARITNVYSSTNVAIEAEALYSGDTLSTNPTLQEDAGPLGWAVFPMPTLTVTGGSPVLTGVVQEQGFDLTFTTPITDNYITVKIPSANLSSSALLASTPALPTLTTYDSIAGNNLDLQVLDIVDSTTATVALAPLSSFPCISVVSGPPSIVTIAGYDLLAIPTFGRLPLFGLSIPLVSTVSSTSTVTITGADLTSQPSLIIPGSEIVLTGSAAGTYTVSAITDSASFTVLGSLPDSGTGTVFVGTKVIVQGNGSSGVYTVASIINSTSFTTIETISVPSSGGVVVPLERNLAWQLRAPTAIASLSSASAPTLGTAILPPPQITWPAPTNIGAKWTNSPSTVALYNMSAVPDPSAFLDRAQKSTAGGATLNNRTLARVAVGNGPITVTSPSGVGFRQYWFGEEFGNVASNSVYAWSGPTNYDFGTSMGVDLVIKRRPVATQTTDTAVLYLTNTGSPNSTLLTVFLRSSGDLDLVVSTGPNSPTPTLTVSAWQTASTTDWRHLRINFDTSGPGLLTVADCEAYTGVAPSIVGSLVVQPANLILAGIQVGASGFSSPGGAFTLDALRLTDQFMTDTTIYLGANTIVSGAKWEPESPLAGDPQPPGYTSIISTLDTVLPTLPSQHITSETIATQGDGLTHTLTLHTPIGSSGTSIQPVTSPSGVGIQLIGTPNPSVYLASSGGTPTPSLPSNFTTSTLDIIIQRNGGASTQIDLISLLDNNGSNASLILYIDSSGALTANSGAQGGTLNVLTLGNYLANQMDWRHIRIVANDTASTFTLFEGPAYTGFPPSQISQISGGSYHANNTFNTTNSGIFVTVGSPTSGSFTIDQFRLSAAVETDAAPFVSSTAVGPDILISQPDDLDVVAQPTSLLALFANNFGLQIDRQETEARQRAWIKFVSEWINQKGLPEAYQVVGAISGFDIELEKLYHISELYYTSIPSKHLIEVGDPAKGRSGLGGSLTRSLTLSIESATVSTNTVAVVPGFNLLSSPLVFDGATITISRNSAEGTYAISSIIDSSSFTVSPSITTNAIGGILRINNGFQIEFDDPEAEFVPSDVGRSIQISGAADTDLDRLYFISEYISPTSVLFTESDTSSLIVDVPDANNGDLGWEILGLYTDLPPLRPNFDEVNEEELSSLVNNLTLTLTSTTHSGSIVTIAGYNANQPYNLANSPIFIPGAAITIKGSSSADGVYHIATIVDPGSPVGMQLTTVESIPTSTGGTVTAIGSPSISLVVLSGSGGGTSIITPIGTPSATETISMNTVLGGTIGTGPITLALTVNGLTQPNVSLGTATTYPIPAYVGSVTHVGTGTSAVTLTGLPFVNSTVVVTITVSGTVGVVDSKAFTVTINGVVGTPVLLSNATSYLIPSIGLDLHFGAGSLVAADTYSFQGTGPTGITLGFSAGTLVTGEIATFTTNVGAVPHYALDMFGWDPEWIANVELLIDSVESIYDGFWLLTVTGPADIVLKPDAFTLVDSSGSVFFLENPPGTPTAYPPLPVFWPVTSTTNSSSSVTIGGGYDLTVSPLAKAGNLITISGNAASTGSSPGFSAGIYEIDSIVSATELTVIGPIVDSVNGGVLFSSPYPIPLPPPPASPNGQFQFYVNASIAPTLGWSTLYYGTFKFVNSLGQTVYVPGPSFDCSYCAGSTALCIITADTIVNDPLPAQALALPRLLARLKETTPAHVTLVPEYIQTLQAPWNITGQLSNPRTAMMATLVYK